MKEIHPGKLVSVSQVIAPTQVENFLLRFFDPVDQDREPQGREDLQPPGSERYGN